LISLSVEFSVLDLFDALDSELKKISSSNKGKKATSFVRYNCWLDAHQFVVVAEKNKTLDEARVRIRVLAQAGLLGADDASISDGDMLDEDDNTAEMSDEEASVGKESVEGESDNESVAEVPVPDAEMEDDKSVSSESSDDDNDETSDEEEGDEADEAAAEEAYMRQLEDEAFESELRRLTMDALEKGKVTARSTGGKVSDQMIAAPQFVAKKTDQFPPLSSGEGDVSSESPFEEGMQFKLFKRGNKGKQEAVQFNVPKDTNLAKRATKHDDAAAKEREELKARVLDYEALRDESGGNVYLEETKIQSNRNKKLTIDVLQKNFGKQRDDAPYKVSELRGRGGRGRGPTTTSTTGRGRGPGRGRGAGRLFNPGRGRT